MADGWSKRVTIVQWWSVAGVRTQDFTEGEKAFLLETGQPPNQGVLVNLTVAELLNELPAFNGTNKLRVQNSPLSGTYSEGMNPIYTQELKIYFSISNLPMSMSLVFVSSFHFFRLKFGTYLAPPVCVLCVPSRLTCLIASSRYLIQGQCVVVIEMFTFCCSSRNKNTQKIAKLILHFAKWQHRCAARHSITLCVWPAKFSSVSNTGIPPSKLKIFRCLSSK